MTAIKHLKAREILDSRGNPTVEVDLFTDTFMTRASVPSGASTGVHEALELRDGETRYNGSGVRKAVDNVNRIITPSLLGLDVTQQKFIDEMLKTLDGTENKSKLGANAILGVSMAVCKAGAMSKKLPLYKYINQLAGTGKIAMPKPYFNVINGGKHAGNSLDIQEFMIVPMAPSFREALRMGAEVYHNLKKQIKEKYGLNSINVGDEGGFAPPLENNEEPLKLIVKAIEKSGYTGKIKIAIDCAASEFFYDGKYLLGKKSLAEPEKIKSAVKSGLTGEELSKLYLKFLKEYPVFSLEDLFAQDDWESWSSFMKKKEMQIVGDDLLVTNTKRIKMALDKNACNSLLLKLNQIGTVTEAIDAANLARGNDWSVVVSHRSGETEESFIADLVVGLGVGNIKSGAPCRGERLAKYNQLLRIEEEL